jgi:Fe-S-cluster containining protein
MENVFDFCHKCKLSDRCCEQLGEFSGLSAPIVSKGELRRMRNLVGNKFSSCINTSIDNKGRKIRTIQIRKSGSCIFHENGRCSIYENRPFDCMIFPLDIFEIDSHYHWIVYDTFCGEKIDFDKILRYGEFLLKKRESSFLKEFAWDVIDRPVKLSYTILKEIVFQRQ